MGLSIRSVNSTLKLAARLSKCLTSLADSLNPSKLIYAFHLPEQQYYNAMKRKGYNPPEEDVSVIVAIHNIINEQGWSKIKEWESLRGCEKPKLKQFSGRPKDISPKAYMLNCLG